MCIGPVGGKDKQGQLHLENQHLHQMIDDDRSNIVVSRDILVVSQECHRGCGEFAIVLQLPDHQLNADIAAI